MTKRGKVISDQLEHRRKKEKDVHKVEQKGRKGGNRNARMGKTKLRQTSYSIDGARRKEGDAGDRKMGGKAAESR